MAEVDMNDIDSISDIVSTIDANDVFFDAVTDDIQSKNLDQNGSNDDVAFLKKIEEAISDNNFEKEDGVNSPPAKKICSENISRDSLENDNLKLNTDLPMENEEDIEKELLGCDKDFLDTVSDEKSENELLKSLDNTQEETSIGNEAEKLIESSQTENECTKDEEITKIDNEDKKSVKENDFGAEIAEHKNEESKTEVEESEPTKKTDNETIEFSQSEESNDNLLELSQTQPKELLDDDNTVDDASSDAGSMKNQQNDLKGTISEMTSVASSAQIAVETKSDENIQNDVSNIVEISKSDEIKQEQIESLCEENEKSENQSEFEEDEKMAIDESSKIEINQDIEMSEDNSSESHSNQLEIQENNREIVKTESKDDEEQEEKEEESDSKTLEPIKFNFMKKFATSIGKLSRAELEEVVMHKLAEKIVYDKKYAECRIKCEKQEEIIENLKSKIAILTKQYNDLDMIHKRIIKDLAERPDQPVTPVKITRAVGLQVYPPAQNNGKSKPSPNTSSSQISVKPSTPVANTNKRPSDASSSSLKESEAKKKRSGKIITPMRPPLSEKEKASLDLQEASIEQKIRKIVKQPDVSNPQVTIRPVVNRTQMANGMINKPNIDRSKTISSSQPIDLTDEDEIPTNPPALVAIQRTNPLLARAIRSPQMPVVRTPEMINRGIVGRSPGLRHPAPLPSPIAQVSLPGYKKIPPRPTIRINNVANGIIVSWTVDTLTPEHEKIATYQIYAYEETRALPSTDNWKHVGDVKALLLPMAVTLTQFQEGQKYFFAVRAVDIHNRVGQFSMPKTWS